MWSYAGAFRNVFVTLRRGAQRQSWANLHPKSALGRNGKSEDVIQRVFSFCLRIETFCVCSPCYLKHFDLHEKESKLKIICDIPNFQTALENRPAINISVKFLHHCRKLTMTIFGELRRFRINSSFSVSDSKQTSSDVLKVRTQFNKPPFWYKLYGLR